MDLNVLNDENGSDVYIGMTPLINSKEGPSESLNLIFGLSITLYAIPTEELLSLTPILFKGLYL